MEKIVNNKPIAVMGICNTYGIAIFDIVYGINDYIISAFNDGENYSHKRKTRIFYDNNDRPYFNRYRVKYYLDEFMRIDWCF